MKQLVSVVRALGVGSAGLASDLSFVNGLGLRFEHALGIPQLFLRLLLGEEDGDKAYGVAAKAKDAVKNDQDPH